MDLLISVFSTFWYAELKTMETDFKISKVCTILGQSDIPERKIRCVTTTKKGMSNLASKFGQIGPKWDKSWTF